jgi:hypothetical protein
MGAAYSGKPVNDNDRCTPCKDPLYAYLDEAFRFGINRTGSLVVDYHRRVMSDDPDE